MSESSTHTLVIDARSETLASFNPCDELLGLTFIERLALAGRRAGFDDVSVVTDPGNITVMRVALMRARDVDVSADMKDAEKSVAIAPACFLGEVGWLSTLRSNGEPSADQEAPLDLSKSDNLKDAEDRLLRGLVKETDGFMSRKFARPISLFLSRRLAPMGVTPNQMTFVCMMIGLLGAPFFLSADPLFQAIGGLLFVAHSVTDGCDGELARLTYTESRFGGLFDFASDNLVHVAVFGCMAWGWYIHSGSMWPLYFGAGAVVGTVGSALAVYVLTMRKKTGTGPLYTSVSTSKGDARLGKMLDDLSRRDFIYLVFAMSVFGQAHWFVAMTGIGAPVFLILVIGLALKNAVRPPKARP